MNDSKLIRHMVELGVLNVVDGDDPIVMMVRFEKDELPELRQIRLRAQAELLVRIFANDGFLLNRMLRFAKALQPRRKPWLWLYKALAFLGLTKTAPAEWEVEIPVSCPKCQSVCMLLDVDDTTFLDECHCGAFFRVNVNPVTQTATTTELTNLEILHHTHHELQSLADVLHLQLAVAKDKLRSLGDGIKPLTNEWFRVLEAEAQIAALACKARAVQTKASNARVAIEITRQGAGA